ncbi:hypothetical protein M9H77_19059 [Catharanthus roseus]|uniref:Uncharacterized protein n=1 Tax=Catharanthus roseus TaxID=4058 RepID=A0ACC0B993_CATRO|nr:hypothetical protein M9H77_19059 [Catharanthus roseus]
MDETVMWILNVDGFAREKHKGTGFILEDSNGHQYAYALLANLHTTRSFEITHILVKSDSQVVIGQVTGEFDAKEDSIEKYLECVQHLSSKFSQIMFENVPQKEICMLTCCLSSVLESLWKGFEEDSMSSIGANFKDDEWRFERIIRARISERKLGGFFHLSTPSRNLSKSTFVFDWIIGVASSPVAAHRRSPNLQEMVSKKKRKEQEKKTYLKRLIHGRNGSSLRREV